MPYKFENLEVWQPALDYIDLAYQVAQGLPRNEEYDLQSQLKRAATSIALNIAEGSQGQSDAEQSRFLGIAIRSLIESVACQKIIQRRGYFQEHGMQEKMYEDSKTLTRKLQSFRNALTNSQYRIKEEISVYGDDILE